MQIPSRLVRPTSGSYARLKIRAARPEDAEAGRSTIAGANGSASTVGSKRAEDGALAALLRGSARVECSERWLLSGRVGVRTDVGYRTSPGRG